MKIWQPGPFGMKTLTREGQILAGLLIFSFSVLVGTLGIFHPMNRADRPFGFIILPCGAIGGMLLAWIAYRQKQ